MKKDKAYEKFKTQVHQLTKDASGDKTIHLKRYAYGETEVICGYVSPEYAESGTIITQTSFTVQDFKEGLVSLKEMFHAMNQEIEARLEEI
jgi:hypothetical protein